MQTLDDPGRIAELRALIQSKGALRQFYTEIYGRYRASLNECPKDGLAVELGSGGGFAQRILPELHTTDVLPYDGVDRVLDATRMPFKDRSVRFFGMMNVFHHIPDPPAFLSEAERCLVPGGRMLIIDQHVGWISTPILRYLHHEPFQPGAHEWKFKSTGPLTGANGALAWIVFVRDRMAFAQAFPRLELRRYRPFAPLTYWLTGGLKWWSLLPSSAYSAAKALDEALLRISPEFGSFVDIEVVRR